MKARRIAQAGAAGLASLAAALTFTATAQPAAAYPWDTHVTVVGSTRTCVPNGGGWMWYQGDSGDRNWAHLSYGTSFTFTLSHVPTDGELIRLSWGVANCSQVRYFVVSRPIYGNNDVVGNVG
jgi:hypothetical protein